MTDNQDILNQITLMKEALKFYANEVNYEPDSDMIDKDRGSQARYALEQLEKIREINEEMGEDYVKLLEKELDKAKTPDGIKKLINEIKNIDNANI